MKKKAYCYKINLHFLFLTAICHKGGKFLGIRDFFSIFFAGINFRGFNKIEYFAGTNFRDFGQKLRKARKLVPLRYDKSLRHERVKCFSFINQFEKNNVTGL